MCCIIYIPAGVKNPTEDILDTIYEHNHDGMGYVDTGKSLVEPSMGFVYLRTFGYEDIKYLLSRRDLRDECIIHFRAASRGTISYNNIQPFYDEGSGVYFAHNGTFHNIESDGNRSDSNIFFNDIFVPLVRSYGWDNPQLWEIVKSKIEKSRVIFMNNKGEVKMFAGDPLFRNWQCIEGVYYSRMYDEIADKYE